MVNDSVSFLVSFQKVRRIPIVIPTKKNLRFPLVLGGSAFR